MQLFFLPLISDKKFTLPEQEAKHCVKVLRLKQKDIIWLTCGDGTLYEAEISNILTRTVEVKILKVHQEFEKRGYSLHVVIAPTKSLDRLEWFVEKATEIGIDEITPIITDHSERKNLRNDRIEKVIVAAMKQSLKAYKPRLNKLIKFAEFLENFNFTGEKYIATCLDKPKLGIEKVYSAGRDVTVLIGPEGDFTAEELETAVRRGFRIISLGKSRLRTETAGVATCYAVNLLNQTI
jgi:16S rRNA (uracil1498-N3)-methyltransferase